MDAKIGRNDPCSCGSGKKYKQCCLLKKAPGGKKKFTAKLISGGIKQENSAQKMMQAELNLMERTFGKVISEGSENGKPLLLPSEDSSKQM